MSYFNGQRIDEPTEAELRAHREEGQRLNHTSGAGETGNDTALCSIDGCGEVATGMVRDVNSPKYGDPRCDEHAVHFIGSPTAHPFNCQCASCETSDFTEADYSMNLAHKIYNTMLDQQELASRTMYIAGRGDDAILTIERDYRSHSMRHDRWFMRARKVRYAIARLLGFLRQPLL